MSRAQHANDRAADWIIRREDGAWSEQDQQELDAWLAESDGNRAAYLRLKHSWKEADRIGALGASLDRFAEIREQRTASWSKRLAIAASLLLMVGVGSGVYFRGGSNLSSEITAIAPASAPKFDTPVGGRQVVALIDGSKVELNTASLVRTSITEASRDVWLEKGEAYFEVAHLNGRPFVVHAGNRTVTVLGTKFSVRRDGDKVTVSVVEGRVRVADANNVAVPAAVITAGDVAIAQGPSTLMTVKSEERVANALAWRGGMLSFDQSPLPAVAAEFNRYNRRPLVVRGSEASNIRIGGAFPASDPEAFARLLRDAYSLHVDIRSDAIIISD
jgi:transmembrane sensor